MKHYKSYTDHIESKVFLYQEGMPNIKYYFDGSQWLMLYNKNGEIKASIFPIAIGSFTDFLTNCLMRHSICNYEDFRLNSD